MQALILGPHPGHSNYSITNYFDFCRSNMPLALKNWSIRSMSPGRTTPLNITRYRSWWENYVEWPFVLGSRRAELFHMVDQGLAWYAGVLPRAKYLATINDLIAYLTCRGKFLLPQPPWRRKPLILECVREIRRMDHLISASQFTADCLVRELDIPASRITVVHHHVDDRFAPMHAVERTRARERWFGAAEQVIIHVGSAAAYKNRIGALKAFVLLHAGLPDARMCLVHAPPTDEETRFLQRSGCSDYVRFLPPISRTELREFYGAADVLIFPSLYEGFGWPPLEAMACGCPVVCTNRASLKEVVGDAAITVEDPHDHVALAASLHAVLTEPHLQSDLRTRGLAHARSFAPSVCRARIAEIYRHLIG